jgi:hypothetical protein
MELEFVRLPRLFLKRKQRRDRHSQTFRNLIDGFERRRIDASFYEAEEIHRDTDQFSEFLLRQIAGTAYVPESASEPFSKVNHWELA